MNRKDFKGPVTHDVLENQDGIIIDFEKLRKVAESPDPVVPVVVQDAATKEVLILAYANEKALRYTLESGIATFWSTSRHELWIKGKTSGDELHIVEVRVNCEQNSLLYLVNMKGKGSCHVKDAAGQTRFGCYYRKIKGDKLEFVK
ncbi:MAG: phosphoribosyl-AMP cyclohydrolase [Candidatus Omnitrophica bacterium]|nr:phosphoribosyl-AMP cyclohydrolase [Candidatus Omnitrophota bacterium]